VAIIGYLVLTVLLAYLAGSIPTGFLVAKARGIDIRKLGSGNIGATNVFRILGRAAGIFVLLADALKGVVPVVVLAPLFCTLSQPDPSRHTRELFAIASGLSAILGHNYTCWLNFRGGKGIATSAGVLLGLVPWSLAIIFGIWLLVFAATRFVSLASICASFTLPFAALITKESWTVVGVTAAMAALAIFKHKSNIKRLIEGTESRFGRPKQTHAQSGSK
jgi:glycerol-3-phosphate acyltransferase PlsY